MSEKQFRATVASGQRGRVFIEVPFDPAAVWGKRRRHHVKGWLGDVPFDGAIGSRGGTMFVPLSKQLRARAGVRPGDTVRVRLVPADAPESAVPDDLAHALRASARARRQFDALTPFGRSQFVGWIEGRKAHRDACPPHYPRGRRTGLRRHSAPLIHAVGIIPTARLCCRWAPDRSPARRLLGFQGMP